MTFKGKLLLGLGMALLILAGASALSYRNILQEKADAEGIANTHRVIENLDALLTDLIDGETGERGFLLTGKNIYLEPYTASLGRLHSDLNSARKLTAGSGWQQRQFESLQALIASELSGMRRGIEMRGQRRWIGDPGQIQRRVEKQRMDRIRSRIAQMKREEGRLLRQRLEAATAVSRQTKSVVFGGDFLGFLFLLGAGMLTYKEIARRQETEHHLRVSEARFKDILESVPDAVVIVNQAGRIVLVNAQTENLFGYERAALLGKPVETLVPDRFRHLHEGYRGDFFSFPRSRPMGMGIDLSGLRQDGTEFPAEVSLGPMQTDQGMLVSAMIRDISARVRMEKEIKVRNAQLETANQELEAFCYSVSHDLRAPLRSIDGFSQALLEDQADRIDTQGRADLDRIRAATQRMGELIDDLLSLSRVTRAEISRKPTDLSEIALAVAAELRHQQPDREVEMLVAPGLIANADPHLMRIVLENLLSNSWKFTSKRQHPRVEFGRTDENGSSAFFVRDNGAGFDPSYSSRLFGAFQRLHSLSEFPGTGVGLATIQRIIHRHGGKVWGEGQVEQGATFYFRL